jgi:hypothetical protein
MLLRNPLKIQSRYMMNIRKSITWSALPLSQGQPHMASVPPEYQEHGNGTINSTILQCPWQGLIGKKPAKFQNPEHAK